MPLLVGLSRVRQSIHDCILPPPPGTGLNPLSHLTNLKSDLIFKTWCVGFDSNRIRSVDRAWLTAEAGRPIRTRALWNSIVPVPIPAPQPWAVPLDQHQNQMELHSVEEGRTQSEQQTQDDIHQISPLRPTKQPQQTYH
jgi:hypothetical protein